MTTTSCAPLRDAAKGQRQLDPTSQDLLGVSIKSHSRSTCTDINSKDGHSLGLNCDSVHTTRACDQKGLTKIRKGTEL